MSYMGLEFSETEVSDIMNEVDRDGNGEIGYEEFVKMMSER
jgi:calmodulin